MTLRHSAKFIILLSFPNRSKNVFNFIRWVKPMGCDDVNVKEVKVRKVSLQLGILPLYYTTMILDGK